MSEFQRLVGEALKFWFPDQKIIENYRPDWLAGLELDFYFPDLKFGVEVNGTQHYLYVPQMQANTKDFLNQRRRDESKRRLLRANQVRYVVFSSCHDWYKKLRATFPERTFPLLPPNLRAEITTYRRTIHRLRQQKWVAIKVKHDGTLIPTNRVAANYLEAKRRNSPR